MFDHLVGLALKGLRHRSKIFDSFCENSLLCQSDKAPSHMFDRILNTFLCLIINFDLVFILLTLSMHLFAEQDIVSRGCNKIFLSKGVVLRKVYTFLRTAGDCYKLNAHLATVN